MVCTSLYTEHYTTKYTKESDFKKDGYRTTISRKICIHEGTQYSNFLDICIGAQEGINIPIWIFTVFRQSDREHDGNLNNDTFCRLPVTPAQVIIGTVKYPDSGILLKYDGDDYSHGYGQIKEALKALTIDNFLLPYKSENDFRSSNDDNDIGSNVHSFDIRYQKNFESAQPVKVVFNYSENIPAAVYVYALVLTNRLVSISLDGQRMLDLSLV